MNKVFDWGYPGALGTMTTIYSYDTQVEAEAKFRGKRLEQQQFFDVEAMRRDPDNQNWFYLCCWFIMTEEFMREFKDYMVWGLIKKYQKVSKDFLREMKIEDE